MCGQVVNGEPSIHESVILSDYEPLV
jgi:hypothetical protein